MDTYLPFIVAPLNLYNFQLLSFIKLNGPIKLSPNIKVVMLIIITIYNIIIH